ncbi:peptidase S28 [Glomus cerebriforme]|uniref:Peptidase S28 n=1 Tax=Glomus cerebriforme TaxID=658196 RepID=A0A397SKJ4_9GLOM|nr:peptidase S28 [Glomus cerebriforme]
MMKYFSLFFIIATIVSGCSVKVNAASILLNLHARSMQSPQAGINPISENGPPQPTDVPSLPVFYYNQTIDHFDKNSGTFLQRYYINSTFYKEGGPIFLHTPGETGINPIITTSSFVSELATSFNGLLISIEHRYYGESYPPINDLSTPNMKFLTVDQALLDFANFIKYPPQELNIAKDSKWITVGGSYAGNLATWMREKFPNLVFAAYVSSAPIEAKLDFFEFDQGVVNALPCAQNISDAFKFVYDPILMSGNDSAILELKQQFGLEMLQDNKDFASAISHPTASIVQNYVPPQTPDQPDPILSICAPFAQSSSPEISAFIYSEGVKAFLNLTGVITPEDKLAQFATTSISTTEKNDLAPYTYQYCNELGYYQTFPKSSSLSTRSQIIDIDYYQGQCNFLFPGIVSSPTIQKTNKKFGGFNGKFSRTVFVNGDIDPWTALTVSSKSANPKVEGNTIFLVKGGSHVRDFAPPSPSDSDSLNEARTFVYNTLAKWLYKK